MTKKPKRFAFDVQAAIAAAWELCWNDNLEQRKKAKAYRPSTTYYLTASDLECQVRRFAEETAAGERWGTRGRAYGRGYGTTVRLSGNLQSTVRSWLHRKKMFGELESHNFGRGHISGARYRPRGEPMAEAELETLVKKEARKSRPTTWHFGLHAPACTKATKSRWGRPSKAWCTSDVNKVTCPRCLKLMKSPIV